MGGCFALRVFRSAFDDTAPCAVGEGFDSMNGGILEGSSPQNSSRSEVADQEVEKKWKRKERFEKTEKEERGTGNDIGVGRNETIQL